MNGERRIIGMEERVNASETEQTLNDKSCIRVKNEEQEGEREKKR